MKTRTPLALLLCLAAIFTLSVTALAAEPPVAVRGTWQNATVTVPGQPVSYTPDIYNSSFTADQFWLAVTTTSDDQAIRMEFADVNKGTYAYLYKAATLESGNPTSGTAIWTSQNFSSDKVYQYKPGAAGVYYLMVRPSTSGNTSVAASTVTLSAVTGDHNESNDTWQTADDLTVNASMYYTLHAQNDVDWFRITTTVPGEAIKFTLSGFDYTVPDIDVYLYSGTDLAAGKTSNVLWSKADFSDTYTSSYKANDPGDYYLKITTHETYDFSDTTLRLSYTTVAPDANESNDTWQTADAIGYSAPVAFTLNGVNDKDWFYFETTKPNEVVELSITGFLTDYSNKIYYDVFKATPDGYDVTVLYNTYNGINRTHTQTMGFAQPGKYYIRIRCNDTTNGPAVENELLLTLTQGATDDLEPNDTWDTATFLPENTEVSYSLPASNDKDWFKFTVTEPGQTVELTSFIPTGGNANIYLRSGDDILAEGPGCASLMSSSNGIGSGTHTMRYLLPDAGDYYIQIGPYASKIFEEYGKISYKLIPPDENESNNTWQTATTLNEGIAVSYTLPASNDKDFFRFSTTEPNQTVELTSFVPAGGNVNIYIYSYSDYITDGNNAASIYYTSNGIGSGTHTMRWMLPEVGDYYVLIATYASQVFDDSASISYRLIEPDEYELNNTWKTASALNEGVTVSYTFPATNDKEFFKFTTTKPYQTVELVNSIPSGGNVNVYIYSESNYNTDGDGAAPIYKTANGIGSGKHTLRWMLDEADTYYVLIDDYASDIFDEDATLTYRLIDPDANEYNNTWQTATQLSRGTAVTLTLPSNTDTDWFCLGELEKDDQIRFTFGNVPNFYYSMKANLYVLKEGAATPTSVENYSVPNGGTTRKDMKILTEPGTYYLQLNTSSWDDQRMWISYTVSGKNVPVTGISNISNGDATIFEGQTLQLYANVKPANASDQTITWSSSNTSVATVDEYGLVTAIKKGSVTITASAKDGLYVTKTSITVAEPVPASGITVTANDVAHKGETQDNPFYLAIDTGVALTATVLPENATNRDVIWSVSDPEVLVVTDYGRVWAVGSGDAWVTVTSCDGSFTADFYINVPDESFPVRGIALNYNAATIYMGETGIDLVSTVSPSYATNPGVVWSSDNPAVATVDASGHVTPVSVGYATITVSAVENSAVKNTCVIAVQPVRTRVEGIRFSETEISVGLYGDVTLLPIITPADATDQSIVWTTSNKTVATVSRTGVVTTLNLGTAIITATTNDGAHVATVTIHVRSTASLGDINNDGASDAGDALMILRYCVSLLPLSDAQKAVADVNGDGSIDAGDAILMLRYDAGLIDKFPAEGN